MAAYSYDESGQYNFFLITFLTFLLVPWTYYALKPKDSVGSRVKPPTEGWTIKHESVRRGKKRAGLGITRSGAALALGWLAFAYVLQRAYSYESAATFYDPYEILGVSSGISEKDVKRHYRKLSLKFHPDKLRLAENQTKEEADAHFVELTKAYKALTDETVRENYEQYGHPDGKQEFSMGIALPKWIVETQNNGYVLGIYGLIFGVLMPYFVGRWWYGSKRYTKDGVYTRTAEIYFREIKEEMDFEQIVNVFASSLEFSSDKKLNPETKLIKSSKRDFEALEAKVNAAMEKHLPHVKLDGKLMQRADAKRAALLIYAHLLRVPIESVSLLRDRSAIVNKSTTLCQSMMNIALAHSWLGAYLVAGTLQQHMIQGFHPVLSPLLQLPNISVEQSEELAKNGVKDFSAFLRLDKEKRKEILRDMPDKEQDRAVRIAQNFPKMEVVSAKFQVVGETVVTPGSFVQLNLKVRITPPTAVSSPEVKVNGETSDQDLNVEEADEKEVDELIGRKKGQNGESPDSFIHAPHFPSNRRPAWQVFVGDHKLYRVFVPPTRFTQFGYNKIRTLQLTFQAPPNPGLYTFQTYVKNDSYVGADGQKDMMMEVKDPATIEAEQGATIQNADDEDDISEPEEDTIAGQMAAMRGQPFKKIEDAEDGDKDEDEYTTSGTDEDEDDDSSSSSDSDSD